MASESSIANAVGGKTARACDSCIRRRARWYCAADDAFLCQACDATVHSANPLARRHERVRLKTSSLRLSLENSVPAWHKGFTKKARTPRHAKQFDKEPRKNMVPFVPEVSVDENSHEENEEHELLFRVPSCDPYLSDQFCMSGSSKKSSDLSVNDGHEVESLHGLILPSELDIAEFAADVESLLGKGLDDDCYGIEGLGLNIEEFDHAKDSDSLEFCFSDGGKVKLEEENSGRADENSGIQMERVPFEIGFDYEESEATCGYEGKAEKIGIGHGGESSSEKRISLSLDYEAIIAAWSNNDTPWFNGDRPHVDFNEGWTDCMGSCGTEGPQFYGRFPGMGRHIGGGDGGREARVLRYREKRRTRLFSKKIRYEVRKLNAEKRPRMKGRFVKRATFPESVPLTLLNN